MTFFLLSLLVLYSPDARPERLVLSLGEKARLPLPADQTIRIGNKSLVAIQKEGGGISLLARKEGWTRLSAGGKNYDILIFSHETKLKVLKIDKLLKSFWGLSWSLSEKGDLQITGTLNRLSDWIDLMEISRAHSISYQFKAQLEEGLEKSISHYFNALFKGPIPPEILPGELPFVRIPQGAELSEYEKQLQPFGLIAKEDPLWLFPAPFIEIEMVVVESLRSSSWSFGGSASPEKTQLNFGSLLGFLNFLKSSGGGKALHHSSIIAQSGQKLQIQSGGQIPFHSYNFKTEQKSASWKSHGLNLSLTPRAGKKGRIELDIQANMSEPLAFAGAEEPPPLKTQSWTGKITVNGGQIVRLFQLKKQSQGQESGGQFGLSDLTRSLLSGNSRRQMAQTLFIQAKIKNSLKETEEIESALEDSTTEKSISSDLKNKPSNWRRIPDRRKASDWRKTNNQRPDLKNNSKRKKK